MEPLYIVTTVLDIYPDGGSMSMVRTFPNGGDARSYFDVVKVQGISTELVYADYGTEFLLCHYVHGDEYTRYHLKETLNSMYGRTVTRYPNNH